MRVFTDDGARTPGYDLVGSDDASTPPTRELGATAGTTSPERPDPASGPFRFSAVALQSRGYEPPRTLLTHWRLTPAARAIADFDSPAVSVSTNRPFRLTPLSVDLRARGRSVESPSDWPCNSNSVCLGSCRLSHRAGSIDGVRAFSRNPGRRARPPSLLPSDVEAAPRAQPQLDPEHGCRSPRKMANEKADEPPQAHNL